MKFKIIIGTVTFLLLMASIGYVLSLDIPDPAQPIQIIQDLSSNI